MSYTYNVSVILVNYNGKRYIDNLFNSLVEQKLNKINFEVIFVDNASSDDSVKYLKSQGYGDRLNLQIVETGENLGFAGGNNAGVKAAKGEYIILLNNDTVVTNTWLQSLYDFMIENPDCCMANSKLLFFYDFIKLKFSTKDKILLKKDIIINGQEYCIDNKFCRNLLYEEDRLVCFGHSEIYVPLVSGEETQKIYFDVIDMDNNSKIYFLDNEVELKKGNMQIELTSDKIKEKKTSLIQNAGSGINKNCDGFDIGFGEEDSEKFSTPYEISNGCGASIIMKKQNFIDAGMFDEKFFMYYEDTDLSYRMKKYGNLMYCPYSVVRHIHTGSSTEWSPFFIYHVYRNKLLFIYKNFSKWKFYRYYYRQLFSSMKCKNEMMIRGTKDSKKIIQGEQNIHY